MSKSRRAVSAALTLVGTLLVLVGVVALAVWALLALDRYVGGSDDAISRWYPMVGITALVVTLLLRFAYKHYFGVGSEAEEWLKESRK